MAITASYLGINFQCFYGRWHCNITDGDYEIVEQGIVVHHVNYHGDPDPIIELVVGGVLGPAVGPGNDGSPELKTELKSGGRWEDYHIKGVFIGAKPTTLN